MLQSKEAHIRVAAARLLGSVGERIPLEPLIETLHDPEKSVRLEAIWALANAGGRMPQAALRALLDATDQ